MSKQIPFEMVLEKAYQYKAEMSQFLRDMIAIPSESCDEERVVLRIKQSGDIFQVLLNGKVLPIKNQDDHVKAIAEIVQAMDAGRSKFQKILAAARVKPPAGIRTAAPKMEQVLTDKRDALKSAIAAVRAEISGLTAAPSVAT